MSRNVVITGVGVISPLGDRPDTVFQCACDGRPAFGAPTVFDPTMVPGQLVAEVPDFAPEPYVRAGNIRPLDRTGRLALVAAELALADSGWDANARAGQPIGLILGTMFCSVRTIGEFDRRGLQAGPQFVSPMDFSNTVLNAAAGQVAIWHRLTGVNSTVAAGAASGVQALGYAAELIRAGRADVLVAGGAEEICFESSLGFARAGRLARSDGDRPGCGVPFDSRRTGAVLGEGAAFLVLEAEEIAGARGARIAGRLRGWANAYDPDALANGDHRSDVLEQAIEHAVRDADVSGVDVVSASASGHPILDLHESIGIAAAAGRDIPVTAIKAVAGESLGAAGALQTIVAMHAMRCRLLPGIAGLLSVDPGVRINIDAFTRPLAAERALVTATSHEGHAVALVLSLN
ncbi:MAG TPA: beta-ketoacyl synthase N-terminal-like domain-containing protein [Vicinamibacterales bacterium]|nr:beta-ketoacyl synthase N-terminal-like domain-containing protein [Vicinamibacterales bacterium]